MLIDWLHLVKLMQTLSLNSLYLTWRPNRDSRYVAAVVMPLILRKPLSRLTCSYYQLLNMSSLQFLVNSRKYLRSSATRVFNDKDRLSSYDAVAKQNLIGKLNKLTLDLADFDSKILNLKFDVDDPKVEDFDKEMRCCEEYQDNILTCLTLLNITEDVVNAGNTSASSSGPVMPIAKSLLKSPTAPLPTFASGEGESLELFFNSFEETLGKFQYTNYDKLLLLKQQISGKASFLIDSLDPDKQSYNEAKALLMQAFATTDIQKFNIVKQLSEMSLNFDDEPFCYMATMRKIKSAVIQLDIKIDVLQYFFFKGMNQYFKSELVQITNNV